MVVAIFATRSNAVAVRLVFAVGAGDSNMGVNAGAIAVRGLGAGSETLKPCIGFCVSDDIEIGRRPILPWWKRRRTAVAARGDVEVSRTIAVAKIFEVIDVTMSAAIFPPRLASQRTMI